MGRSKSDRTSGCLVGVRMPLELKRKIDLYSYELGLNCSKISMLVLTEYLDEFVKVHREEYVALKTQRIAELEAELKRLKEGME